MMYRSSALRQNSEPHFYLHEQNPIPPRRTWSQIPSNDTQLWGSPKSGFYHSEINEGYKLIIKIHLSMISRFNFSYQDLRVLNGENSMNYNNHTSFVLNQNAKMQGYPTMSSPPQQNNIHRQISRLIEDGKRPPVSLQQMDKEISRRSNVSHAPIPAPSVIDMEPQSVSFIGNADEDIDEGDTVQNKCF